MTSLTLATLLHVSVAAVGTQSYADAHRVTTKTGKPMLVMVSAEWCGACKQMEKAVLPQLKKRGLLKKVSFAIVNADRQKTLANKLTRGGSIPQLVMYRRSGKGWLRRRLVGGQNSLDLLAHPILTRAHQLKNLDRMSSSPHHQIVQFPDDETLSCLAQRCLANHDPRAVDLVRRLQPGPQVHVVSEDGVIEQLTAAHVPHDHVAGVNPDPGLPGMKTLLLPPLSEF